jgi:multiple sugar transport system permease protein
MHRKHTKAKINEWFWGWFMIAPMMIGLMVLNIIPAFQTLYLSFFKAGAFGRGNIFVGFDNYMKMIHDDQVWYAVGNTIKYTLIVVPAIIVLSMIIAVLLNNKLRGKHIYRTIYFIPAVATPAAVAMVWRWLYNNYFGVINVFIKKIGLQSVNWVNDPKIALFSVAIIGIWSIVGYNMVIILAGLQVIPNDYYEASNIDGASPVCQFFRITVPLVSPAIFFVMITSIFQSMQVFDIIYMMIDVTSPAYDKTVSLVYLFYNNSFKYMNQGYGSVIVMLLLVIVMVVTVILVKMQRKLVNYM